jgi:hypothetical protein
VTTIIEASLVDDEDQNEDEIENGEGNEDKLKLNSSHKDENNGKTKPSPTNENELKENSVNQTQENVGQSEHQKANNEGKDNDVEDYVIEPDALEAIQYSTEAYLLTVLQGILSSFQLEKDYSLSDAQFITCVQVRVK